MAHWLDHCKTAVLNSFGSPVSQEHRLVNEVLEVQVRFRQAAITTKIKESYDSTIGHPVMSYVIQVKLPDGGVKEDRRSPRPGGEVLKSQEFCAA